MKIVMVRWIDIASYSKQSPETEPTDADFVTIGLDFGVKGKGKNRVRRICHNYGLGSTYDSSCFFDIPIGTIKKIVNIGDFKEKKK